MTANEKKDVLEEKMNESLQELAEVFEGEAIDTNEDEVIEGATDEEERVEITEENMTSEMAEKNIIALLKQVKDMVGILESMWRASESEFELKDSHMKELMAFNSNHLVPLTEGATDEERENWDPSNGLDALTEEDVVRIFGEEHKIIGVEHDVTLSRIKDCFRDFYGWLKALREYGDIQDSYMTIMEEKEEMALQTLREAMEKEEDPEKKEMMQKSIDLYINRKTLGFLRDSIDEKTMERILNNYKNEHKVSYWIQRTRDKLKQMKISQKFILEISHFETRFLEEKYHKCDNMLLMYFMSMIVYMDINNKDNPDRNKVACMVFALDRVIRNKMSEEQKKIVIDNIIALEDQFLAKL
jgi:hypothetical protein